MKLSASLNVSLVLAVAIAFVFGFLSADVRGQSGQQVQVEVSQVLFGTGPTVLSSTANGDIDLAVGVPGLESVANIVASPFNAPLVGVTGSLFVQANSLNTPMSAANALFDFEFSLPLGAEELLLLYIPGNSSDPFGNVSESSFLLTRDQTTIFSATDQPLMVTGGLLPPGDYTLTIQAGASATNAISPGFTAAQPQFAFNFVPVPEPTSPALAATTLLIFSLRRRKK